MTCGLAVGALVERDAHTPVDHDVLPPAQRDLHLRHDVPLRRSHRSRARARRATRPSATSAAETPCSNVAPTARAPERLVAGVAVSAGSSAPACACTKPSAGRTWPTVTNGSKTVTPLPSPSVSLPVGRDDFAARR